MKINGNFRPVNDVANDGAPASLAGSPRRITVALATSRDRQGIYQIRHEVYARELRQHPVNSRGYLRDALDDGNIYIVARHNDAVVGFISLTAPTQPSLSIDKYFARESLPFCIDAGLREVRLLTVCRTNRGSEVAVLLMYAALRWVEAHGGEAIVALGRREILPFYRKAGLSPVGRSARSGEVTYELLRGTTTAIRARLHKYSKLLARHENRLAWQLHFPFHKPAPCFHGGAFFDAIGPGFRTLESSSRVINADVLDAWFAPAPGVLATLRAHLGWLLRTSPPTGCEGLIEAIAAARGLKAENVLPGAGSSDLIFRALRQWLTRESRVLLLDPTYGEYTHVLQQVIGCRVDRISLARTRLYDPELSTLAAALNRQYDLIVLVNPNSPTGRFISRATLEPLLRATPAGTRVWIDETYMEYVGMQESLERFAASSENVVICKSMSKVYALSGARAAYLCAAPHQLEELRAITPPWVVGLPSQVAAVRALEDPGYYARRYAETHALRARLRSELCALGWEVIPGLANFLLCHLPESGPDAAAWVSRCREDDLFIRDAGTMSPALGRHALRLAVKDEATQERMLAILRQAHVDLTNGSAIKRLLAAHPSSGASGAEPGARSFGSFAGVATPWPPL